MNDCKVVVDKSTVLVEAGKLVREIIQKELDNGSTEYILFDI